MSVSSPFIKRPIATSLLAVALLLAGFAAFTRLPVSPLPRVDFPTISVSASLPGASPETMASSVATPLERRFGRIAGVTEITSSSSLGSTSLTLQFDLNRDVDGAARDVQAAIAAAGAELPPGLPFQPTYRKVNPSDTPIMILSLTSTSLPLRDVFEAANTILAQKVAQVEGVGQVFVTGGQQKAVRVQIDPVALAGLGLSLEDVRLMLAAQTVDVPKGTLISAQTSSSISTNDQLFAASAFQELILATQNGSAVRLKDVADVFDDVENNRVAAWTNGVRSVSMIMRRQPGANIIETCERVKALIPSLAASIPPTIDIQVALDRTTTIRASVEDVEQTLIISIVLVVVVVFVFLRSARATAIPSIAVPLSLVGTFGVMYMLDYSLDNLSLMALTISTGFVVDDAIVVTENISRFIELGDTPMVAAFKGAKQIGFTIISITISLLAVFIPILMMGGIVGRLFREFAVTLSVAIGVSALISLTLTPMMCSRLLKRQETHGRLYRISERGFEGMVRGYDFCLRWVLRHRLFMQFVTLATVAATVFLFMQVRKGFFPQQDTGVLIGSTEAPQDVSFKSMFERQQRVNTELAKDPDVAHYVSSVGGGYGSSAVNNGQIFIELRGKPARTATADEVIARLRPALGKVEGIKAYLTSIQDVRVGGRSAKAQYQYTLQSGDLDQLQEWANVMLEKLKTLKELKEVNTDLQVGGLELDVDIDRDTAARFGISPQNVDDILNDAYGQRQVATNYTQMNQYRVVMEVKPAFQRDARGLEKLYVRSSFGGQVPLGAFTKLDVSAMPLSVNHQSQFPSITLSFNLASDDVALSDAIDAVRQAEVEVGKPATVQASFSGTAQAFQASLASEPILIGAALLTVYMVLGVLYESYIHPITILSTLPSAGLGALAALLICNAEFNIIGLIGIILLIGIVKKNAILMIDFAIEAERERGLEPAEAIHQACLLRFRPIMMTTMAALLGGLPLALGTATGSELRRPLGITIVGGLIVSQMLTLFTTPVIYLALDRFSKNSHRKKKPAPAPVDATTPA